MKKILIAFFVLLAAGVNAQPFIKEGLEAFVTANNVYPQYSLQNCIQGTVTISFKLNRLGEVYYSKVSSGIGTDLDDEGLRLIRMSSGHWTVPASHDTTMVLIAPMKFTLSGFNCADKNPQEIKRAIAVYRSNEALANSIQIFYKNKEKGDYRKEEEPRFIALKKELGYDDDYLKERIADGLKKLKQQDRQGACEDFRFVKYMGSNLADELLATHCK